MLESGGRSGHRWVMLRLQLFLLTLIPIVFLWITMALLMVWGTRDLSHTLAQQLETRLLADRQAALQAYATIAQSAIAPNIAMAERSSGQLAAEQAKAKQVLAAMDFGEDGYFYVYDFAGTNLVHPRQTHLQGQALWHMQDPKGDFVIQNLIAAAQRGGDFHGYVWNKPSTGQETEKLGYAVGVPQWGWMIGTGHYLDDLAAESAALSATINQTVGRDLRWIMMFGLIAIAAAGAIVFLFQVRLQHRANTQLQSLNNRIVDIQETQAKRISQDLHDGVSQSLVLAGYAIEAAQAKLPENRVVTGTTALLSRARQSLSQALDELRQMSKSLRPPALDQLGLSDAILTLAEDVQVQSNLQVKAKTRPFGDHLSDFSKTALFRVAQEALTNVTKHAHASTVTLQLFAHKGRAYLIVSDDGKGMGDVQAKPKGFGLQNMTERLQSLGGKLTIEPAKSGGTRLIGWLPLESA